jgi:hypothetical protein
MTNLVGIITIPSLRKVEKTVSFRGSFDSKFLENKHGQLNQNKTFRQGKKACLLLKLSNSSGEAVY